MGKHIIILIVHIIYVKKIIMIVLHSDISIKSVSSLFSVGYCCIENNVITMFYITVIIHIFGTHQETQSLFTAETLWWELPRRQHSDGVVTTSTTFPVHPSSEKQTSGWDNGF